MGTHPIFESDFDCLTDHTKMARDSTLPQREKQLFHKLVKSYEQKQFKQGLKHAKAILGNQACKDHGETLSMKGLILSAMNKKEEALELAKLGLKNDFKSGTCWHVYGLILRAEKKYEEAIKAYSQALKWENGRNQMILKDLSHLQIQMRDLEGFKQSRLDMLSQRPTLRASWIGYAIANHLSDDHQAAYSILEEFRKTNQKPEQRGKSIENDYEMSEIVLYQNKILMEDNKNVRALANLAGAHDDIVDRVAQLESLVELYMKASNFAKAEECLNQLIHRNPEKRDYFIKLADCVGATCDDNRLMEFYRVMQSTFPRAKMPQTLPLEIFSGDKFEIVLKTYFIGALRKCLPNIHVTLKLLYSDAAKLESIQKLAAEALVKLEQDEPRLGDADSEVESPGCLVWLYHFLAQHYDAIGQHVRALDYVNRGLDHTPTLIELYVAKGQIYKHAGNEAYATECIDEAQSMDTADRFLNCKCARYMIRSGRLEEAEKLASLFTRENITLADNLKEMQVLWFQIEAAEAHFKRGQYGQALRKCYEIECVFADVTEDQFDFHQYCMRKMTLSKYVDMLRLEDRLRIHRFFRRAAIVAINIYLEIADNKWNSVTGKQVDGSEQLSESELKKRKRKAAKQALKKKQEDEKKKKKSTDQKEEKEDPLAEEKLIDEAQKEPLQKAKEWAAWIEDLNPEWLEGQLLAYQVAKRRNKPLQQARALKRAIKLSGGASEHPAVHEIMADWASEVETRPKSDSALINEIIETELEELNRVNVEKANEELLERNGASLAHRLAYVRVASKVENKTSVLLEPGLTRATIEQFEEAIGMVEKEKLDAHVLLEQARTQWPLAVAFGAAADAPPRVLKPLKLEKKDEEK